jgi:hypothetical protein
MCFSLVFRIRTRARNLRIRILRPNNLRIRRRNTGINNKCCWSCFVKSTYVYRSVADLNPGSGFLPPGSGIRIRDEFFPDIGSRIRPLIWWHFLTLSSESMLFYLYNTGLLLKLTHKTVNTMNKLCLILAVPAPQQRSETKEKRTKKISNASIHLETTMKRKYC